MNPSLRLAGLRLQDFRAVRDLYFPFAERTTVLIGMNNVGKTAILAALEIALGSARPRTDDLRLSPEGPAEQFVVDVRVEPATGNEFSQAVVDVVGAAIQFGSGGPDFFVLRCRGDKDPKNGDPTVRRTFLKGWEPERAKALLLDDHPTASVSPSVRALISYDLLDARRDAVEQLRSKRTYWGKITSDLKIDPTTQQAIEGGLRALHGEVLNASTPLQQLQTELADLGTVLGRQDVKVAIETLPTDVSTLLRSMDLLLQEYGQDPLPLGVQGMGTRSLSALLIFRSYVRAVLAATQPSGALSVSAFEEPEAHLHPQAQRAVLSLLRDIPGQRLISTHSPFVVGSTELADVRLIRRVSDSPEVAWIDRTSVGVDAYAHIQRFVQRRNAELLFARAVVLVEGHSEDALIPVLAQQRYGTSLEGKGVSIVPVEGAMNYKHFVVPLEHLRIPWLILADGDAAGDNGLAGVSAAIGRTVSRNSLEVSPLPVGMALEDAMLADGLRPHIESAIASFFGATALGNYKTLNDGQSAGKGKPARDYTSAGWEERLVRDFLKTSKGLYGAPVATALAGAGVTPSFLESLFKKLDVLLS